MAFSTLSASLETIRSPCTHCRQSSAPDGLNYWEKSQATSIHPPTDMHQHIVSCGCGFALVLGVLDMVGPSAGKSLSTIDEGRSDHAKHQDFRVRSSTALHLPTATAPLSTVGTGQPPPPWVLDQRLLSSASSSSAGTMAPMGTSSSTKRSPGLVTHNRTNHGHRREPNGGTGTTPRRKRLGNDQPCQRCQEHLNDVAPERRFFSKWRKGPGPEHLVVCVSLEARGGRERGTNHGD